mmetsp:Transcript_62311/g.165389  ORF Transcript_62311/g.165389 Transcript_62311/m.165389 type:complete len:225 (-) Transcript_62311:763-1437(-)
MHRVFSVVLFKIVKSNFLFAVIDLNKLGQEFLVVLRPSLDRQLCNLNCCGRSTLGHANNLIVCCILPFGRSDSPIEALIPGKQTSLHGLLVNEQPDEFDDVSRVVVGQGCRPTCSDSISAVDQCHGDHWDIPLRLDGLAFLILKVEQRIVVGVEDEASDVLQPRVDVPCAGSILAALQACPELSRREQNVQIVGPNEGLRHAHNGTLQRSFTVMVGTVLRDVPR